MKNKRQEKILELVRTYDIDTQETLIGKLAECGFTVTQTTVSRDIRDLRLVKDPTGKGTYKYVSKENADVPQAPHPGAALTDAVRSIETAQNLIVVKTLAGMANAVAVCLDSFRISEIIGTVAGDDTILLVVKDSEIAEKVEKHLRTVFFRAKQS